MANRIDIRKATLADAARVACLNASFNGGAITPEQIATQLTAAAGIESVYLAAVEGHTVGFSCLRMIPTIFSAAPYAEVTELFVEEAYRRYGVGRALMQYMEDVARSAGVEELFLMTGFKNTNAHHFYHAIGFSLRCFTMYKAIES